MTSPVVTVTPATHCKDAAALLVEHHISALPVVDGEGRLVGIVSESDLLPMETSPDPRSQETPLRPRTVPLPRCVADVMTTEVLTVEEQTDAGVIARRMLDANVRRFPVMRGDLLVGIVSRHDLIRAMARSDNGIAAAVSSLLREEGLHLGSLDIRVVEGVVELAGDGDRETLRLAEILARSVPGVLDVRTAAR